MGKLALCLLPSALMGRQRLVVCLLLDCTQIFKHNYTVISCRAVVIYCLFNVITEKLLEKSVY